MDKIGTKVYKNGRIVDKIGYFSNVVDITGHTGCSVDEIEHTVEPLFKALPFIRYSCIHIKEEHASGGPYARRRAKNSFSLVESVVTGHSRA